MVCWASAYFTASDVNTWFVPFGVYKTANTNRTSNALLIDPDIQVNLAANAFYHVSAGILYTGGAGIGFAWAWTIPAGAGGGFGVAWNQSGFGAENQGYAWSTGTLAAGTPGTTQSMVIEGYISTSGSGTFGLNWATNTNGSTATAGLGSVLVIQRVG